MTSKTELLEQKRHAHQCRKFVTTAAICADKTLITLNVLNSNEHTYAAQRSRFPSRFCCAAWACPFELKMLRLIRVSSAQIAAAVTNCLG